MSYSWAGAKKRGRALKRRQYIWFLKDANCCKWKIPERYNYDSKERSTWGVHTRKMFKKARTRRQRYMAL